jgi:serine/threonine-protein kinase
MSSDDVLRPKIPGSDSEMVTRLDTAGLDAYPEDVDEIVREVRDATMDRHTRIASLGTGGMGEVHLVSDRALQRRAVMKRLHERHADDPRTVRMFVREAQITGQLEHPNIVPVHDLGIDEDATVYFTMKLVEGRTLEQIVRELPPHPLEHTMLIQLLEIVTKTCDALAFAHSRGIIHCDVKPGNVMVGDYGEVYLMDWGLARRASGERGDFLREDDESIEDPVLIGTASFMAPEQALGKNEALDERTDVFAVGAMIYYLLCRRPPYREDDYWSTIASAQRAAFPPLEIAAYGSTPRTLLAIVTRAMAENPGDRFPSIAALKAEIMRFVRGGDFFPQATFAPGTVIVREGESGDAAYILKSGRCQVTKTIGHEETVLREMGPGDVFGEMAILARSPRTATVTAITQTTVHVVTADALDREVDAMKPWMGSFVRTLAERFREREAASISKPKDPSV